MTDPDAEFIASRGLCPHCGAMGAHGGARCIFDAEFRRSLKSQRTEPNDRPWASRELQYGDYTFVERRDRWILIGECQVPPEARIALARVLLTSLADDYEWADEMADKIPGGRI